MRELLINELDAVSGGFVYGLYFDGSGGGASIPLLDRTWGDFWSDFQNELSNINQLGFGGFYFNSMYYNYSGTYDSTILGLANNFYYEPSLATSVKFKYDSSNDTIIIDLEYS